MSDNEETLYLHEITDRKVPINTAVILNAEPGDYRYSVLMEDVPAIENNDLRGYAMDVPASYFTSIGYDVYTLAQEDGVVGFYKYVGETLLANKAFLPRKAQSGQSKPLNMHVVSEQCGIEEVKSVLDKTVGTPVIYDLHGNRVSDIKNKGIYIVNGKKVLVK